MVHTGPESQGRKYVRVVGHVDNRLLDLTIQQLRLVLNAQQDLLLAVLSLFLADSVDDPRLDLSGETLIAIFAHKRELDALTTINLVALSLERGDLFDTNGLRAVPDLLAPTLDAAVQVVDAVVGGQGV